MVSLDKHMAPSCSRYDRPSTNRQHLHSHLHHDKSQYKGCSLANLQEPLLWVPVPPVAYPCITMCQMLTLIYVDILNRCKRFSWLGHIFSSMIDCLRSLCLVKSGGFAHLVALGLVSRTLLYVTVKTVISIDLVGMLRSDCSGQTRHALHTPSSS